MSFCLFWSENKDDKKCPRKVSPSLLCYPFWGWYSFFVCRRRGKKPPNQQLFICYQTKTVKKSKESIPAQKPELFDLSGLRPGQLAKPGFFLRTARGQRLRKDAHCSPAPSIKCEGWKAKGTYQVIAVLRMQLDTHFQGNVIKEKSEL